MEGKLKLPQMSKEQWWNIDELVEQDDKKHHLRCRWLELGTKLDDINSGRRESTGINVMVLV